MCLLSAFFSSSTEAFCTTTTAAGRGEPGQPRRAPGPARPIPASPARTDCLAVRLAHPHRHGLPVLQGHLRADLLCRHLRARETGVSPAWPLREPRSLCVSPALP